LKVSDAEWEAGRRLAEGFRVLGLKVSDAEWEAGRRRRTVVHKEAKKFESLGKEFLEVMGGTG